ncbi:hypothetical protein LUZ60_015723 [Juncus effusus]|nr:hypothetical protein LUZ60_015723 [Juncus effusus]
MRVEEERLRSLIVKLNTESSVLERVVYKNKNQHRRARYFQFLLKVRRDLKLFEAAKLSEILNALFPIIDGTKPAENALQAHRAKKQSTGARHSYHERLLGVTRLLSQMIEPIIKAAIQISLLLAKSFFIGFSILVLALLARIRVLVQQILVDVVNVFNEVSRVSQTKQSVKKLSKDGVEAFREYYPRKMEAVIILKCTWKKDKFMLIEKSENNKNEDKIQEENEKPISPKEPVRYETIQLFTEDDQTDDVYNGNKIQTKDNKIQDNNNISKLKSQEERSKRVAFISVGKPNDQQNKKPKLNLDPIGNVGPLDPLLFSENNDKSIF